MGTIQTIEIKPRNLARYWQCFEIGTVLTRSHEVLSNNIIVISLFHAEEVNLARGQPATQSSTWGGWDANRVVDGNYNTDAPAGSCSATNDGSGGPNWLMVDLGSVYTIEYVVATNRGDSCSE